jgi:hypothetical protein
MTAAAHRDDWRSDAACLSADPDLFFPVSSSGPSLEQVTKTEGNLRRRPGPAGMPEAAGDAGGGRDERHRITTSGRTY